MGISGIAFFSRNCGEDSSSFEPSSVDLSSTSTRVAYSGGTDRDTNELWHT